MILRLATGGVARSTLVAAALVSVMSCARKEAAPTTDAERTALGQLMVQQMSLKLAAATEMTVTTTESRDVVRRSGTKERKSVHGVYTIRRPDRFHTTVTGGKGLETWYDGKKLTVAVHEDKVFAQARMPETVDRTLDALAERYDMALPLSDLFYSAPAKALLSGTTTGGYVGDREGRQHRVPPSRVPGHRRSVGALAAGPGGSTPGPLQDDGRTAGGPTSDRRDLRRLEPVTESHGRQLHPERTRRL